ncbi:hypothetical protein B0T24DRAFT_690195 [Lasiosphaeria ovina]|uniref:SGNH hydrolase-type esterase domain-containing protein n=1 Tax=Lasiosphaeria ovina TaxID=92902 RepID=A0AAE0JU35_9PEZI|nr:hypothetical protein B0T24DRAFT_690195 [Lasiosphaeria ovina]
MVQTVQTLKASLFEYEVPVHRTADINAHFTKSQLASDGIHPNDAGYKFFAAAWWDAISKLEDQIQPPSAVPGLDDTQHPAATTCPKVAGKSRGPVKSQTGSGHDDGPYVHSSIGRGMPATARIDTKSDPKPVTDAIPRHMVFANIVDSNPDANRSAAYYDWIRVYHGADGNFGDVKTSDVGVDYDSGPRPLIGVGDDFYCIHSGSAVSVSLNSGGNPPTFESIEKVSRAAFYPQTLILAMDLPTTSKTPELMKLPVEIPIEIAQHLGPALRHNIGLLTLCKLWYDVAKPIVFGTARASPMVLSPARTRRLLDAALSISPDCLETIHRQTKSIVLEYNVFFDAGALSTPLQFATLRHSWGNIYLAFILLIPHWIVSSPTTISS